MYFCANFFTGMHFFTSFLPVSLVGLFSFLIYGNEKHINPGIEILQKNDTIIFEGENHFKNVRQLTFGGDNAEAYFSYDGKYLIFQKTYAKEGIPCDQMFIGKVPESLAEPFVPKMVSTGKGRTTCGFFTKDGKHVIYASTHLGGDECPPVPDRAQYGNKYIWPLYRTMDIFMADLNGKIVKRLTKSDGYDAEATLSPDGKNMV